MSLLYFHVNGKAKCKRTTFTYPASVHYFCSAGPYSATFVDDEAAAIAWCERHKGVKKRAAFTSAKAILRPNLSLPDPNAPLTRIVPRDTRGVTHDKITKGKKKVRTF